jgi:hypothetical protein
MRQMQDNDASEKSDVRRNARPLPEVPGLELQVLDPSEALIKVIKALTPFSAAIQDRILGAAKVFLAPHKSLETPGIRQAASGSWDKT